MRYDDEKAIKDTHFNSDAFQTFAKYIPLVLHCSWREGQRQGVNHGPPDIKFGPMLGGWLTRPNEPPRDSNQVIAFSKLTTYPGKRSELNEFLIKGMDQIKVNEPGTLSILLIEDESDPDVVFVMERFKDQAAVDAHMNNPQTGEVRSKFAEYVKAREGVTGKEVAGFISKND